MPNTRTGLKDYLAIARPDHWVKHIFVLPGLILALVLLDQQVTVQWKNIVLGLLSACAIASANYVINEWLDAEFDKFHPIKKDRPAASGRLRARWVYGEYGALLLVGVLAAVQVNKLFTCTIIAFVVSGLLYNVQPFRLKDRIFLDVLSESLNNPLRLILGWSMVSSNTIPPLSLIIFYWFAASFLMTTKRLGEYRYLKKQKKITEMYLYRRSFKFYSEEILAVLSFLYGLLASFLISAFLIKYRHEFLFVYPSFAALFAYYFYMGLRDESIVQTPEKLHKDKKLLLITSVLIFQVVVLSLVDIKIAQTLVESRITSLYEWLE